jgi:hypothetical protein
VARRQGQKDLAGLFIDAAIIRPEASRDCLKLLSYTSPFLKKLLSYSEVIPGIAWCRFLMYSQDEVYL